LTAPKNAKTDWQFTSKDARIKLKRSFNLFVETASKGKLKPENTLNFNALSVIIHPIRAICLFE